MKFIGVSFAVIDGKLIGIATSEGLSVANMDGLRSGEALAFLSTLAVLRSKDKPKPALVMYDTAIDIELLLKDLPARKKDILFGLYRQREDRNKDLPLYDPTTLEYRGIASYRGFRVAMLPGKILRISKETTGKHGGLSFYDIGSYFSSLPINEAVATYLGDTALRPVEKNLLPLWREGLAEDILDRCEDEARLAVRLAARVAEIVEPLEINQRQWYGPSATAARCLHKWKARKQAKRLNEKNSAYELIRGIDCAYFGGRVEAYKLGTIPDIMTLDLNSAYAYATTLLAEFHTSLRFTRRYEPNAPFSCWLVKYRLPDNVTLGLLPTRHSGGGISFRREGQGYFWQPEIDYVLQRYPDCVKIAWGYVGPEYKPVKFAKAIRDMYDYRMRLRMAGDAGESIIKLALSNLYGKFAQNTGAAHFQCRAWAGWITSFIRRLLLEAVTGHEDRVICFCQDAVHVIGSEPINVAEGNELGQWKVKRFASGLYIAPGIYELYEDEVAAKSAVRGSNLGIDFKRVAQQLSDKQVAELSRSFFVGWVLARQARVKFGESYLTEVEEQLDIMPTRLRARSYQSNFDWLTEYRDSTINQRYLGQSARYVPNEQGHSAALRLKLKDRGWI